MEAVALRNGARYHNAEKCEFNSIDFTHLTGRGHAQLADTLLSLVKELLA